jgi:hypothetical protein
MTLIDAKKLKIQLRPVAVGIPKGFNFVKSGILDYNDQKSYFIVCSNSGINIGAVKVFIGSMNNFSEVEVIQVNLRRDGGSVFIKTAKGEFLFPHSSRDEPATFNGKPIDDMYQ